LKIFYRKEKYQFQNQLSETEGDWTSIERYNQDIMKVGANKKYN